MPLRICKLTRRNSHEFDAQEIGLFNLLLEYRHHLNIQNAPGIAQLTEWIQKQGYTITTDQHGKAAIYREENNTQYEM